MIGTREAKRKRLGFIKRIVLLVVVGFILSAISPAIYPTVLAEPDLDGDGIEE